MFNLKIVTKNNSNFNLNSISEEELEAIIYHIQNYDFLEFGAVEENRFLIKTENIDHVVYNKIN